MNRVDRGISSGAAYRHFVALSVSFCNVLVLILLLGVGSSYSYAALYLSLSFILFAVLEYVLIAERDVSPLNFMFLLYWGYGLIIPGLFQVRLASFYWTSTAIGPELGESAALIVFLATIAYGAGQIYSRLHWRGSVSRPAVLSVGKFDRSALVLSVLLFSYCVFLLVKHGPIVYFAPRQIAEFALQAQVGSDPNARASAATARTLPMALAIAMISIALSCYRRGRTKRNLASVVFSVLSNLIVNFPIAIPRYFLLALFMTVVLSYFQTSFRKFKVSIYVATPLLLYIVFPFLGSWNRGVGLKSGGQTMNLTTYLRFGDLDGLQSIMNIVYYVKHNGFGYGVRLLSDFFFYVPRSVWPSKALATGPEAAAFANYSYLNISMPIPGEFYADFGVFGAIVLMFIFSVIVGLGDSRLRSEASTRLSEQISILLCAFMPIIARGALLSTIQAFAVGCFLAWLWSMVSRLKVSLY